MVQSNTNIHRMCVNFILFWRNSTETSQNSNIQYDISQTNGRKNQSSWHFIYFKNWPIFISLDLNIFNACRSIFVFISFYFSRKLSFFLPFEFEKKTTNLISVILLIHLCMMTWNFCLKVNARFRLDTVVIAVVVIGSPMKRTLTAFLYSQLSNGSMCQNVNITYTYSMYWVKKKTPKTTI